MAKELTAADWQKAARVAREMARDHPDDWKTWHEIAGRYDQKAEEVEDAVHETPDAGDTQHGGK